jgi:hypothetical protein
MASPKPIGFKSEQPDQTLEGGTPTGEVVFLALPEPTYVAMSDEAAKRGMTVAQVFAQAISEFLKKPS